MKKKNFAGILTLLICSTFYFCTNNNYTDTVKDIRYDKEQDEELSYAKAKNYAVSYSFQEEIFRKSIEEDITLLKSFDKPYADSLITLRIKLLKLVEDCVYQIDKNEDIYAYETIMKDEKKLLKRLSFSEAMKIRGIDNNEEEATVLSYARNYIGYLAFRNGFIKN